MSDDKPITAMNEEGEDSVRVLPPDYTIKKKIGLEVDLSNIFTPERIEAAQKAIDDNQKEFIGWAQKDLTELEHLYRTIAQAPADIDPTRVKKMSKITFSLKCQCGTFGFQLGSEVASSLYNYLGKYTLTPENLTVIRKHIDALEAILYHNMEGDGGSTGAELRENLRKLIAKFSKE